MKRIILSGGGTGGHIYPAVAVAEALERLAPGRVEILFVGAEGKMEMEKIPALGYHIEGLPVAGLQRRLSAANLLLPVKVLRSVGRAKRILRDFRPDAVAGFGGYASAPVLWTAQRMGIPTLIQEQNSYAGVTNKILARRARTICVAYEGMERFFPARNIVFTGNPLRSNFGTPADRTEAAARFGLDPDRPTLLIVGGSLGTRTLNEAMLARYDRIAADDRMQVIWQTGRYYDDEITRRLAGRKSERIWRGPFIERMDLAYAAADAVISRAGACSVSELCLVGKPVIFVPSPNVAEDHQTCNARALADRGAARLVPDSEAVDRVLTEAEALLDDTEARAELSRRIRELATPRAAEEVAARILQLTEA